MDIVAVENLVKRFGRLEAVKGVSFAVREGQIFGFLGPNGAGKTTTINVLCTLLRPTAGRATVNGYDVTARRSEVRRSIGLVFQDTTLDEYLTAEQNLRFHAYAYGVSREVRERRIEELMSMVDLWDRRKSKVSTYSGGMKRRLEIARGLLHHPRVLFLDEPTLGLDPQTRRRIWEHVLSLRRQENLTIFLTTHYMDEAEYCDRIAIIDHGHIVALDTPDNLKSAVGGDVINFKAEDEVAAVRELQERFGLTARLENGAVTFSVSRGEEFLPNFVRSFSQRLLSVGMRRPTLDDVFLTLTGRDIREQEAGALDQMRRWRH
ncbi:MAG: ATP-binding cassette domain-containing protein [Chloroflexi bacterium]|nr:ATP-binding cassette domain-containing protein [Chloroflexota bacterium]